MVRQIAHAEAIDGFAREMIEEGILERAETETELRLGDFISEQRVSPLTSKRKTASHGRFLQTLYAFGWG